MPNNKPVFSGRSWSALNCKNLWMKLGRCDLYRSAAWLNSERQLGNRKYPTKAGGYVSIWYYDCLWTEKKQNREKQRWKICLLNRLRDQAKGCDSECDNKNGWLWFVKQPLNAVSKIMDILAKALIPLRGAVDIKELIYILLSVALPSRSLKPDRRASTTYPML